jgi:hypothetical protein
MQQPQGQELVWHLTLAWLVRQIDPKSHMLQTNRCGPARKQPEYQSLVSDVEL